MVFEGFLIHSTTHCKYWWFYITFLYIWQPIANIDDFRGLFYTFATFDNLLQLLMVLQNFFIHSKPIAQHSMFFEGFFIHSKTFDNHAQKKFYKSMTDFFNESIVWSLHQQIIDVFIQKVPTFDDRFLQWNYSLIPASTNHWGF